MRPSRTTTAVASGFAALGALTARDVPKAIGLTRRNSRFWQCTGIIGAGLAVGMIGAFLFAPKAGSEPRQRIRERANPRADVAPRRLSRSSEPTSPRPAEGSLAILPAEHSGSSATHAPPPASRR